MLDIWHKLLRNIVATRIRIFLERMYSLKESQAGLRESRTTGSDVFTRNNIISNKIKNEKGKCV